MLDWQLVAVVAAVALALGYIARRTLRTWRGRGAGCGGCKCGAKAPAERNGEARQLIGADELTSRLRSARKP